MKKTVKNILLIIVLAAVVVVTSFALSACGLLESITGKSNDNVEQLFDKCEETTGKWVCYDYFTRRPLDAYFVFDGSENVMRFEYYENGTLKRDGWYRVVYRGEDADVSTPLTIGLEIKGENRNKDLINAYVDDFKTDFTQFTVMNEEREMGINEVSGTPKARMYRISEMPIAFGTYVKEGAEPKEERGNAHYADQYYIPSGEYVNDSGAKFTFLTTYPLYGKLMFRYEYGGEAVEGIFTIGKDKDKIFLWIDYEPGAKPTRAQKEEYGMSGGADFPPNYNVYGSFDLSNNGTFSIGSVTPIDGYGYDPAQCDLQKGVYHRLYTQQQ